MRMKKEEKRERKREREREREREVKGIKNEFRIFGWQCWAPHLDVGLTPAVF